MFDRDIGKQKLRREHPEWSELEVMHQIIRQAFHSEPVPEWWSERCNSVLTNNMPASLPASNSFPASRYTD